MVQRPALHWIMQSTRASIRRGFQYNIQSSRLNTTDIWYHLGGWNDEGDTWDTQVYDVEQALEEFWATIIGPAEYLRSKIRGCLQGIVKDWKTIVFEDDETLTIQYKDGTEKAYKPAGSNSAAT